MKKITVFALALALLLSACAKAEIASAPEPENSAPEIASAPEPAEEPEPEPEPDPEPAEEPEPKPEPDPEPAEEPEPEPEPEPTRGELDFEAPVLDIALSSEASSKLARLTDGDVSTKVKLPAGSEVNIECGEEMTALYIKFDLEPGEWTIDGAPCGENGFIHDFRELSEPKKSLTLSFSKDVTICDLWALGWGKLPDFVQVWQPPCEEADILLFPTHGDDEHLFFGGTMPYYAGELGKKVQVCYMTNHWNEQPRPHEQLDGLWTVGVRSYPVMSPFNDVYVADLEAAQSRYGADFLRYEIEMIRRFKPLVIIGHDINGEYGHGAHMLAGRTLLKSVSLAADPEYDASSAEKYGVWEAQKLYLHVYRENRMSMDWDVPLEAFGGRTAFEVAEDGYRQHLSQQHWAFHVYPRSSGNSCYDFGLAFSTVGDDVLKNDFLENAER